MLYLLNLEYDFHKEQYCIFQYFQAPNYKNNNIYSKKNLNIPNFQLTRDIIWYKQHTLTFILLVLSKSKI